MLSKITCLLLTLPLWTVSCSSEPQVANTDQGAAESSTVNTESSATQPLNFVAPEGWTERAPTAAMRSKEYVLGDDAENPLLVIVAHWPNGVGGLQPNLQRWKGQVSGEGAPEPSIETFSGNGVISTLLDGTGAFSGMDGDTQTGSRLMAAYIESPSGRCEGVYTIKLSGPSTAVGPWADSFRKFIREL